MPDFTSELFRGRVVERCNKQPIMMMAAKILPQNVVKVGVFNLLHHANPLKITYSHSIVPGGLLVTSYTTLFTPFTSLMMRVAVSPRNFMSNW